LFASRARQLSGLPATGPTYTVGGHRLRDLCNRAHECGLDPQTGCRNTIGCPLFGPEDRIRSDVAADVDRRRIVLAARSALVVGIGALGLGGLTAVIGRAVGGGSSQRGGNPLRAPAGPPTPHARHSAQPARHRKSSPANPPPGVAIGSTFQVPVGEAGRFTDPRSGEPAYVVHSAANTFVAFSAVCTHAGCVVGFDSSRLEFICPCHGGRYDAKTGQVVAGPPPSPLPPIPVHVVNGAIRVD
jgi:thiosulfate dehydrogenase [quinone] large subunit